MAKLIAKRLLEAPARGTMAPMPARKTTDLGARTERALAAAGLIPRAVDERCALALGRKANALQGLTGDVIAAGREPTAAVLAAMATALGVRAGWLLTGEEPMTAGSTAPQTYGALPGWGTAAEAELARGRVMSYAIRAVASCPVLVTPRDVTPELVYAVASLWMATANDDALAAARR